MGRRSIFCAVFVFVCARVLAAVCCHKGKHGCSEQLRLVLYTLLYLHSGYGVCAESVFGAAETKAQQRA